MPAILKDVMPAILKDVIRLLLMGYLILRLLQLYFISELIRILKLSLLTPLSGRHLIFFELEGVL